MNRLASWETHSVIVIGRGADPASYYVRSGENCVEQQNTSRFVFASPEPVPDWVLDLLPDAPYSIAIAY